MQNRQGAVLAAGRAGWWSRGWALALVVVLALVAAVAGAPAGARAADEPRAVLSVAKSVSAATARPGDR
ncbi:hypothetical protein [Cellulomonas hominis]|nr:hypothetical protein [Cellulomonas hominis]NKY12087.1 hypothetical protein [Cellulomonas hominis]